MNSSSKSFGEHLGSPQTRIRLGLSALSVITLLVAIGYHFSWIQSAWNKQCQTGYLVSCIPKSDSLSEDLPFSCREDLPIKSSQSDK